MASLDAESEMDPIAKVTNITKIDPTEFDFTISALLIGLGAEKYVDIFRKQNIGQCTLLELSDEDLIKLGIDDPEIRKKLAQAIQSLPIYEEFSMKESRMGIGLGPEEIVDVLEESFQHLHRIHLSMMANRFALKKTKNIVDCLLYKEKYASNIALATLSEIVNVLNSMDIALHTQMKTLTMESKNSKNKKILVGAVGSAVIAVLAVLFARSLKQLN